MKKLFLFLWLLPAVGFAAEFKEYHQTFPTGLNHAEYAKARALRRGVPVDMSKADAVYPGALDWRALVTLSAIYDQKSCGSCVYNGCSSTVMDTYAMNQAPIEVLSRQFQMDCGAPWSCSGSYASKFYEAYSRLGGSPWKRSTRTARPILIARRPAARSSARLIARTRFPIRPKA
jgi:hypothetical protein